MMPASQGLTSKPPRQRFMRLPAWLCLLVCASLAMTSASCSGSETTVATSAATSAVGGAASGELPEPGATAPATTSGTAPFLSDIVPSPSPEPPLPSGSTRPAGNSGTAGTTETSGAVGSSSTAAPGTASGHSEPDPIAEASPIGPPLKVRVTKAPLYAAPTPDLLVKAYLPYLAQVQPLGHVDDDGFIPVLSSDSQRGYCRQQNLVDAQATLFAKVPRLLAYSAIPNRKDPPRPSQLVDVRQADPGISIDLVFATARNFTGSPLYERDLCLLQAGTMEKLSRAQQRFRRDGYSIKIYDAYRPYSVTVRLAAVNGNPTYLANPLTGSNHNRGAAVDMTVVDAQGLELEMPSPMHTMDSRSKRENPAMTPAARQNLAYVQDVMVKSGFVPYAAEWWHYNDSESSRYPHLNLSLADIDVQPGSVLKPGKAPPLRDPGQTGTVVVPLALVPTPTPIPSKRTQPTVPATGA